MPKLLLLPFDTGSDAFQRINLDNNAAYTLATIQTTTPSGTITFTSNAGATLTYAATSYILAQQVLALIDAFVLSPENFVDLSAKLALQLYQAPGTAATVKMTAGTSYLIYGAGFQAGSTATLTNAANTVTLPVELTMLTPGMATFVAPDNTVAPYNQLDAANTNVLTVTNANGQTAKSSDATTAVLYGWT